MSRRRNVAGLRNKRRNNILVGHEEKVTQKDFKLVKERIIANSKETEWEEARREWELTEIILEGDYDKFERFTDKCELCNQPGLKTNFVISNIGTGKVFLVGSSCIKKFLLLKGAETQEQSAAIFDNEVKQIMASRKLQELLPNILSEPTNYEALTFRKHSKIILETLENILIKPTLWKKYLKLLFGPITPPPKDLDQIRNILFQPSKVRYKKVTDLSTGEEEGRWANKLKTKTKVETTLVRSKEDRPDKRY
ncbi:hypothetical protein V6C27_02715 [Peptococcaceae bacterium 1198_IL3148]